MNLFHEISSHPRMMPFKFYVFLAALLGLILRLTHSFIISYSPVTDMRTYIENVWWIFEGKYPQNIKYSTGYPPGYPAFIYLVKSLFNLETLRPIGYVQSVIDSLAIIALAYLARRLYGKTAGIISAFCYAFYHLAIVSSGIALTESLTCDMLIFIFFCFVTYLTNRKLIWLIATGLLLVILAHIRTNLLPIAVVLGLGTLLPSAGSFYKSVAASLRLRHAMVLTILVTGLCVPWAFRNSMVAGKLSFLSNNLGGMLVVGNNPAADGGFPDMRLAPKDVPYPHGTEEQWLAYGKEWFKKYPAIQAFYLIPNRVAKLFWDNLTFWPWNDHAKGTYYEHPFGPYIYVPTLPYLPFLILGLFGFLLPPRHVSRILLPSFWAVTWLPLLALNVQQRYRFVSDPFLIICSANLLAHAFRSFPFRSVCKIVFAVALVVSLVGTAIQFYRFSGENQFDSPDVVSFTPQFRKAVDFNAVFDTNDERTTVPVDFKLCEMPVHPEKESHFVIKFRASLEDMDFFKDRSVADLNLQFLDKDNRPITIPGTPYKFRHGTQLISHFLETPQRFWRIIRIPAHAVKLRISVGLGSHAKLTISDLQLRGAL